MGSVSQSNVPAVQQPQRREVTLAQMVDVPDNHKRIVEALGNVIPAEMFMGHIKVAFSRPEIAACTMQSKMQVVCELAALGLLPTLQQAALIPRTNRDNGEVTLSYMPQWQGYKTVMERSPGVKSAEAYLVHKTDVFRVSTTQPMTVEEHSYDPFNEDRTIGVDFEKGIRGGYLKVTYRDGSIRYHFTPVGYILKCRACSKPAYKSGKREVWEAWPAEMCLKTIYRHGFARRVVNIDPAVAHKLEVMDRADDDALGNDPMRVAIADETPHEPPKLLSKAEQMAARFKPADDNEIARAIAEHGCVGEPPSLSIGKPSNPPGTQDFIAAISGAATEHEVRQLVRDAQDAFGGTHSNDLQSIVNAGLAREAELAKAAETPQGKAAELAGKLQQQFPDSTHGTAEVLQQQDYTSKPGKDSTPEHFYRYTLAKIEEARQSADPNNAGNILSRIRGSLGKLRLDQGQRLEVERQLGEAEETLAAECQAAEGEDTPMVAWLRGQLAACKDVAGLDAIAAAWNEPGDMTEAELSQGRAMIVERGKSL